MSEKENPLELLIKKILDEYHLDEKSRWEVLNLIYCAGNDTYYWSDGVIVHGDRSGNPPADKSLLFTEVEFDEVKKLVAQQRESSYLANQWVPLTEKSNLVRVPQNVHPDFMAGAIETCEMLIGDCKKGLAKGATLPSIQIAAMVQKRLEEIQEEQARTRERMKKMRDWPVNLGADVKEEQPKVGGKFVIDRYSDDKLREIARLVVQGECFAVDPDAEAVEAYEENALQNLGTLFMNFEVKTFGDRIFAIGYKHSTMTQILREDQSDRFLELVEREGLEDFELFLIDAPKKKISKRAAKFARRNLKDHLQGKSGAENPRKFKRRDRSE